MDDSTQLLEIFVGEYKNLRQLRVRWGPQIVLYGESGVGKTNLLEAIALLFGSPSTLWQSARRLSLPPPESLSAVLRTSARVLPVPPDWGLPFFRMGFQKNDRLSRWHDDGGFWAMLGVTEGQTWADGLRSTELDGRLIDLLLSASARPLVRYRLEAVEDLAVAAAFDRGSVTDEDDENPDITFPRQFSRCLTVDTPLPSWLEDMADDLPEPFWPLRTWLDAPKTTRSPYADVLELSRTTDAPVDFVWLAGQRDWPEIRFDLAEAFERAVTTTWELVDAFERMPLGIPDDTDDRNEGDARWWLSVQLKRSADRYIGEMTTSIGLELNGGADAGDLLLTRANGQRDEQILDERTYASLSSGERSLLDEALMDSGADLYRIGLLNRWRTVAIRQLSDEQILNVAEALDNKVEVAQNDYWGENDIDTAIAHLERILGVVESLWMSDRTPKDAGLQDSLLDSMEPSLRQLRTGNLRIRAYDEPERHMHPAKQKALSQQMDERRSSESTVLVTHSHYFLRLTGWTHLYVAATQDGPKVRPFHPADLTVAHPIAQAMGLAAGELFQWVHYVLFVEGEADKAVLSGLYGLFLREAGVLIWPISGIDEALSLAELHMIGTVVDVDTGFLADHTRLPMIGRTDHRSDLTKEERALRDLVRQLKKVGRRMDLWGLKRVDIIAYLDEETIRECGSPEFPGWAAVERVSKGGGFKETARSMAGLEFTVRFITTVVEAMARNGRPALDDLPQVVSDIVAKASPRASDTGRNPTGSRS